MNSAHPRPMQANGKVQNGLSGISGMAARLRQIGTRRLILILRQRRSVIHSGSREL